jgi:hypothetical protein
LKSVAVQHICLRLFLLLLLLTADIAVALPLLLLVDFSCAASLADAWGHAVCKARAAAVVAAVLLQAVLRYSGWLEGFGSCLHGRRENSWA